MEEKKKITFVVPLENFVPIRWRREVDLFSVLKKYPIEKTAIKWVNNQFITDNTVFIQVDNDTPVNEMAEISDYLRMHNIYHDGVYLKDGIESMYDTSDVWDIIVDPSGFRVCDIIGGYWGNGDILDTSFKDISEFLEKTGSEAVRVYFGY